MTLSWRSCWEWKDDVSCRGCKSRSEREEKEAMIARMCLSDLHLGDPRSVLSDPATSTRVADQVADISGGEVGTLVLLGDVWEECVPADPQILQGGLASSVLRASRAFFRELHAKVRVGRIVYVPGNHDLSLWSWYCRNALAMSDSCTPYAGMQVDGSTWPWRDLLELPQGRELLAAYPLYWDQSVGKNYPVLAFTHGHLLDPLVSGAAPEVEYAALEGLGCRRPQIMPTDMSYVPSVRYEARAVEPFCLALWARYSRRDYVLSNYVLRRLLSPQSCSLPGGAGPGTVDPAADQPPPDQGFLSQVPWFLDLMMADPSLPSPACEAGQSCLVYGHDHLAARADVEAGGVSFCAVGSGGWTVERDGHRPHSHVLVWDQESDVVPRSYHVDVSGRSAT